MMENCKHARRKIEAEFMTEMGFCSQCGECCKQIAFGMAYGGADWNEYYYRHGCEIVDGVGLIVPSVCNQLAFDEKTGKYICKIYDTRPVLCRNTRDKKRFYHPPGCTDV